MDHTQTHTDSVLERVLAGSASYFAGAAQRHARNRIYRTTLAELSALSDREIADLGLSRPDFRNIAWEAAVARTMR
ncbi:DUF1127 domain-containing protein [Roseobacter ponti]|uniref:DUF1127 domain-containing protein n=2 Tax=Roseobacteraceae TaxID=2854170 RepID=A0A858SWR1_9RHOB|nr:DUF1127 domain-containing protein [Roseobacter ponti]